MPEYKLSFVVEGKDRGASGVLGKVAGGLGGIAQYAIGDLLAGGIRKIGEVLGGLAKGAIEAVGNVQTLEMAMEGLLTESLMYQKVTESTQVAMQLTAAESKKLSTALIQQEKLTATIAQQEIELDEAKRRRNESDAHYLARMEKMRVTLETNKQRLADYTAQVATLESKQGRLTDVTRTTWQQMMDYGAANEIAKDQVKDLLSFVEQLAIVSPFETEQVEMVARIGLASKLSADQVQEFSGAFLDYAAVHGITSSNLAFAADQFLQLRKIGKLTAIDLRQLRRLGIDVEMILGVGMGMGVAEFNEKIKQSPELMDQLFESFIKLASEGTAGAAQRMAMTISGMLSTAKDIVTVGSRYLFRPIIEALSPFLADLLGKLSEFATGGQLEAIGQQVSAFVMENVVPFLQQVWTWLSTNIPRAISTASSFWTDVLVPAVQQAQTFFREQVMPILTIVGSWLEQTLPQAVIIATSAWNDWLLPALQDLWSFAQTELIPMITVLWTWLQENIPVAIAALVPIWNNLLLPALQGLWQFISDNLKPILIVLGGIFLYTVVPAIAAVVLPIVALGAALVALGLLWKEYGDQVNTTVEQLKVIIVWAFNEASKVITEWAEGFIDAMESVGSWIRKAIGWIQDLVEWVTKIPDNLPGWLTPGSPTPFELGLRGIAAALQDVNQVMEASPLIGTYGTSGAAAAGPQYHLHIHSSASTEPIIADFGMMEAFASAA